MTSANKIVTSRRSCPAGTGSGLATGVPHAEQNRASAVSSAPQTGHAGTSEDPHERQNRAWSRFREPQLEQTLTGGVYGRRGAGGHLVDCAA